MTADALPFVSVIVPHYNDLDRLDICLARLAEQTWPADRVEIVVSDNMSPCGEAAVRDRIAGRAKLVTCTERGAGPTRNAAVAAASHDLLAFTDSDCIVSPGWLKAGIAALYRGDLVGGAMAVTVREPGNSNGAEAFEKVFAFHNRDYVERQGFTVTANLFTRKAVFDAVGGFRTQVAEDKEWCQRAVAAGYRLVYCADALVAHPARDNWAELKRKWQRMQHEGFALALERPGGRATWLLRTFALPASILAHVPRIWTSPDLDTVAERGRATGTLIRLRLWRFADSLRLFFSGTE
jgi:cellulose synthase/poly-beta-1,6-N-acetylglucosamine synthase-like glycosyltransferase